MKQFYLAEIVTKDKLIHQGLFFRPKKSGKKAILWVHGLGSTFYGNVPLIEMLADACEKQGIGFAAFNNRGHDGITGLKRVESSSEKGHDRLTGGAGVEVFDECVYDIDAGVDFLIKQGFTEVFVAGHSTGANKSCFYGAKTKNVHVVGIILLSPLSDRLNPMGRPPWWSVPIARLLIAIGKGSMLIPVSHFPGTPKRLISLISQGSKEDTFDYGNAQPTMAAFSRILKPLFIVFAGADELADRSIVDIKAVFDRFEHSTHYGSIIIPGAFHSFNGKEKEVVGKILRWVSQI